MISHTLAPSDTARIQKGMALGFVTAEGSRTSHVSIMARSMGIPAVVGVGPQLEDILAAKTVAVDGGEGYAIADPDADTVAEFERMSGLLAEERAALDEYRHVEASTSEGRRIEVAANLGSASEAEDALQWGAEGVGLFRTEFLFLDRATMPTEDEQEAAIRAAAEALGGRPLLVRTLDAGADKPLPFGTVPDEPNPALGVRGLRTSRRHPELLEDQLTAVAGAAGASKAEVWVMAPMVSTRAEAAAFAEQVRGHGLSSGGVMVEVPAAAIRATHVAAACDFMSIGTNDLSQYTYAADRMAGELADLKADAHHWLTSPEYAVLHLRLENAHAAVEAALIEARRRVRLNEEQTGG